MPPGENPAGGGALVHHEDRCEAAAREKDGLNAPWPFDRCDAGGHGAAGGWWAFAHPTAGPPAFRGAAAVRRFARRVGATHHRRPADAMPVGMGAPRVTRRRSGVRGVGGV